MPSIPSLVAPPPPTTPPTTTSGSSSSPVVAPSAHHGWSNFRFSFNHTFVKSLRHAETTTNRTLGILLGFRRGH